MFRSVIKSKLFKSTGIYTLTSLINASIPFLLIPFLTSHLSTEDYGVLSMTSIVLNILTPLVGFSAIGSINRKYFDLENKNFARYVGNALYILILSSIFLFLGAYFLGNKISDYTHIPISWLYAIIIIAIAQFINLILLTIWQASENPIKFGVFQIAQSLLNFILTVIFIYSLGYDWEGRVISQIIAAGLFTSIAFYILSKSSLLKFEFNINDIKDILKFGAPLIPHTLGGLLIAFTDRILIANLINLNETGIYTLAYQIGSIIGIISASFNSAYVPWLYNNLNRNNEEIKLKIVKLTYIYFILLSIGAFIFFQFLKFGLNSFIDKEYSNALSYSLWIILGYVFNGMYLMISGFVFYAKKTGLLSIITILVSILNIPICYFMLLKYGTIGASFSMTISFFISFFFTWILSYYVYPMPWFYFLKKK
ncbi:MAG: oligosaccharide flippase family protein [Bacteroidia bacterium]|nr:oligosaccharide flippase family protein [Bacteroidia bacterium]